MDLILDSASGSVGGRGSLLAPPASTPGAQTLLQAARTPKALLPRLELLFPDKATQPLPLAGVPGGPNPSMDLGFGDPRGGEFTSCRAGTLAASGLRVGEETPLQPQALVWEVKSSSPLSQETKPPLQALGVL